MDNTGNGRWLSYSELATIRGINRASAVKLVQRERWPRSTGNDRSRMVRVLVPDDWLAPAREIPPDTVLIIIPAFGREGTGMANALEALREAVGVLRDYLAAAMARADTADADRRAAESRASAAERRADAAEARAATLQAEAEAMRRADAARRGRGRLARLRAAWRGE
jgi:hypothetical protein